MDFIDAQWRKSSFSGTETECVEVAYHLDTVGIRDTKRRDGGQLTVPRTAFHTLVQPPTCE
ncbi:DUF397 domain-containing protein [Actinophytocola sediminis]